MSAGPFCERRSIVPTSTPSSFDSTPWALLVHHVEKSLLFHPNVLAYHCEECRGKHQNLMFLSMFKASPLSSDLNALVAWNAHNGTGISPNSSSSLLMFPLTSYTKITCGKAPQWQTEDFVASVVVRQVDMMKIAIKITDEMKYLRMNFWRFVV